MKRIMSIICCISIISCVQAKRSPFDPRNPASLLFRLITVSSISLSSNSGSGVTPFLSFQSQTYIYTLNESISIVPTVSNVQSCAANPTLPTGLTINSSNCSIIGIVQSIQSPTSYTITARNGSLWSSSTLLISINPVYRLFVTSSTVAGNITIATADTTCNSNINKPNSGTYKAMLVGGITRRACMTSSCSVSENIDWVFKPYAGYFRTDGITLIGKTDPGGVFSTALTASVSNTSFNYWTGLDSWQTSSNNCFNWGSNSGVNSGIVGNSVSAFSSGDVLACNTLNYLLCVEQ